MCDFLEDIGNAAVEFVSPITDFFDNAITKPVSNFIERATTLPDFGAGKIAAAQEKQTAAMREATAAATAASERAFASQEQALKRAQAVSTPAADSESFRRAAEQRMRRLLGSSAFQRGGKRLGDAPVGYKMLTGE